MKTSVEISMYPLSKEYKGLIKDFIKRLKSYPSLVVEPNGMSTQIFGTYDEVFDVLKKEIKDSFGQNDKVVYVLKCVNAHLQTEN